MGNSSKGLRFFFFIPVWDIEKENCLHHKIDHCEICLQISSIFFFHQLYLSCPQPLGNGGILILKSSNHWWKAFFIIWRAIPYVRKVIMVTKGGAKIRSKQLSYTIVFFQGKVTSIGTFKEKKVFIFTSLALKWHMQTAVWWWFHGENTLELV